MGAFYKATDDIAILRERIEELARIRQGFSAHLGASLYDATKDDEALRWGRESLYDGIATCDAERDRILAQIADLEQRAALEQTADLAPAVDLAPAADLGQEDQDVFVEDGTLEVVAAPAFVPEPEPTPAFVPEPEPTPAFVPESAPGVCPNCGSPIEPSFKFCMACGYRLI